MGKRELIPRIDTLGRILHSEGPITRERAQKNGSPIPIVCAALVIPRSKKVIETRRGPGSDLLPNEWIEVTIEHMKVRDESYFGTLSRGLREELGYDLQDPNQVYAPHVGELISLALPEELGGRIERYARFYVVPIDDIDSLTPDNKEVIDISTIRYKSLRRRVMGTNKASRSLLSTVEPRNFAYAALGAVESVMEGKWQPGQQNDNGGARRRN